MARACSTRCAGISQWKLLGSSSPLRVTRGKDRQGVNVRGLYPAGEGAGYAGGIMSAAVDGIETAEAVAQAFLAATGAVRSP